MSEYSLGSRNYSIRVTTVSSLEESFRIQEWCRDTLGDRWAATPPENMLCSWYFVDSADEVLFGLKWL
jgi:hypothetical protein